MREYLNDLLLRKPHYVKYFSGLDYDIDPKLISKLNAYNQYCQVNP